MVDDKYIGLALAILSSLGIGSSFVITKKGLNEACDKHGFEGDGFSYFRSPLWWTGMVTMVIGEAANFAAYAFAPPILVTPLGALSVLIGAVLGSIFLGERLGLLGKIGCAICLIGSIIIVLHAPPDREIERIDEILGLAMKPAFVVYAFIVIAFTIFMIYKVAPVHGRKNPLVYLSICSTVGSLSIMAIKGFGIAVKLTLGGSNQFIYPSTYVFMIIMAVCIITQMNYFNKALSQFSTNIVNPLYYVTFTTFTLIASAIMFQGFNTTSAVNSISLICGFLVIFSGVYLLNLSREDPDGKTALANKFSDAVPTDGIAGFQTRRSLQARRSSIESRGRESMGDREGLMRGYDLENQQYSLADLAEDSEEETDANGGTKKRTSFDDGADSLRPNGTPSRTSFNSRTDRQHVKPSKNGDR